MPRDNQRDISIGCYVLAGCLLVSHELFGLATTLRLGLSIAALVFTVSLAFAAFAHLRARKSAPHDRQGVRRGESPPEQVGRAT